MGVIFYIIGKSSSGKDTIFNIIKNDKELNLDTIVPYTTRPIRDGETEGVEYHFVDDDKFRQLLSDNAVIEYRTYHTMHGDWTYFTAQDDSINLDRGSYIALGVLEAYTSFVKYFGPERVVPIYIDVEDGERLARALKRERLPENRKYAEMCRRFLADLEDFSTEKIKQAGITAENIFENDDLESCVDKIKSYISSMMSNK